MPKPKHKQPRRIKITAVIERDTDRVLFRGTDADGMVVTFHVGGPMAQEMADRVENGDRVEAELP